MTVTTPAEAHTRASVALYKLERFAEAAEEARAALKLEPMDSVALRYLARSTLGTGDIEATVSALTELLSSSAPDAATGIRALLRSGEVLAAARVLLVDPARIADCDPELLQRIGVLLRHMASRKQLDGEQRIAAFDAALALDPDNTVLRIDLCRLLLASDDVPSLAAHLSHLAEPPSRQAAAGALLRDIVIRGKKCFREEQLEQAHDWVRLALLLDASESMQDLSDRIRTRRLSHVRRSLVNRSADGLEQTTGLFADYPDDAGARSLHARALIAGRFYAAAVALLRSAAQKGNATADDYVQLARACRASHDLEGAIGACFDALALHHEETTALALLSQLLPNRQ